MSSTCPICMLDVKVPVEFTCFPCCDPRKVQGKHCHSVTRVCLPCARKYLELNKNRQDRVFVRKCLFCSSTVNPQSLNASKAYRKDYRMMAMDPRTDYKCPQCGVLVGDQNDMERHLQSECPQRTTLCKACHSMYVVNDEVAHKEMCLGMMSCPLCEWRDDKVAFALHLSDAHNSQYCYSCHTAVPSTNWERHVRRQCPNRFIHCKYCNVSAQLPLYPKHAREHILEWSRQIAEITEECFILETDT